MFQDEQLDGFRQAISSTTSKLQGFYNLRFIDEFCVVRIYEHPRSTIECVYQILVPGDK